MMKKTMMIAAMLLGLSGIGAAVHSEPVHAATPATVTTSAVKSGKLTVTPIKAVGQVDYVPGYGVAVWNAPLTGTPITGQTLKHGTKWRVFSVATFKDQYWYDNMAWYNLGGNRWVVANYVNIAVDKTVTVGAKPVAVLNGASYSSNGTGKVLQPGTKWHVAAEKFNGVLFYHLGGHQWARADQFN
ncbi:hypothetical protein [Lacticaseibacillus saniviri]|uniref:Surface layer protein A domain-containing protein n=2 Tax=Lacticaseibacillus saniviri TaxID=931533 RepID=A0A0R2MZW5_9LACO|nr:hypothetical protein [Lacticaseibacillus saniviri]KRO18916.1 hypothetical protein IV56_GL000068 [Lacticaseibacillus saniviri JCM 17471 = DSM 24301]